MGLFICRDLLLPLLPACPHLLDLFFIHHHMYCRDVSGDGAGVGQTREGGSIQSRNRHNETMMYLLWTGGNSASAGSLLHRNISHHNIWSEEQRCLQSKNFWTGEHAFERGLNHFRQDDRQCLLRMLLMGCINIVEQWKQGQAMPRIYDVQCALLMCG